MKSGCEPVMRSCGKGGQCHSALAEKTCCQQAERSNPSPPYSPGEVAQGMLPDLSSSIQKRHGPTGLSPVQEHEIMKTGVSHMRRG